MDIKMYVYEVEEAAQDIGWTGFTNMNAQEFIAKSHGALEATFRKDIREWIKARLAEYKELGTLSES